MGSRHYSFSYASTIKTRRYIASKLWPMDFTKYCRPSYISVDNPILDNNTPTIASHSNHIVVWSYPLMIIQAIDYKTRTSHPSLIPPGYLPKSHLQLYTTHGHTQTPYKNLFSHCQGHHTSLTSLMLFAHMTFIFIHSSTQGVT